MDLDLDLMDDEDGSCSSIDDNANEKELLTKAGELEAQLSTNKYLYDAHTEVINLYRKLADLNSMREAYQRFQECFPLTPKLWLEWIQDEIKIADTEDEKRQILDLFEKAVDDYLSVELWVEYAQYSIGVCDIKETRAILEKGLISAGLHVSEGSLLWDTLREVENAHISSYPDNSGNWINQVKRLAEIFKRQLSVPLLNMENTYMEWTEWFKTIPEGLVDPKPIEWAYKNALKNLQGYKPFEDKLISAEEKDVHDIYREYIKMVKDPLMVICLYERALVNLCLIPTVWEDYNKFSFKMKEVALKVSGKALRNCPWSEELWVWRLRVLEHYKFDEKEVVACFEKGLSNTSPSSLNLWFCYLEYNHRNCTDKSKFDKLFSKALEQITPENDPTYKLSRWYARLVAKRGDVTEARKIWTSTIAADPNMKVSVNTWLEFASLERQYGEPSGVRNVFRKALSCCKDWAQYIGEEWLIFEREVGTLEDIIKCEEKCKHLLTNIPQYSSGCTESGSSSRKPVRNQKRKNENEQDFNLKRLKVSEKNVLPSTSRIIEKDPKTTVFVSNLYPSVTDQELKNLFPNALNVSIVLDRKGKSRCFGYIQFSKEEEVLSALARDRVPLKGRPVFISELKSDKGEKKQEFKYATTLEENKVFVKGLPLSKSKEDVEEIFKPYNPTDVRMVFKRNGQSKGIAYVEFKTKEEARKALELNSKKIDDTEIFVAISAPPAPKKAGEAPEQNEPLRHARSRLQIPMIPRSIQVKSNEKSNGSNKEPKSNADFRNMFLKK